jgi:hypothetical protein
MTFYAQMFDDVIFDDLIFDCTPVILTPVGYTLRASVLCAQSTIKIAKRGQVNVAQEWEAV